MDIHAHATEVMRDDAANRMQVAIEERFLFKQACFSLGCEAGKRL